jgi:hypothetical protein
MAETTRRWMVHYFVFHTKYFGSIPSTGTIPSKQQHANLDAFGRQNWFFTSQIKEILLRPFGAPPPLLGAQPSFHAPQSRAGSLSFFFARVFFGFFWVLVF